MGVDASGGDEAEDNNIEENALLLLNLEDQNESEKFLLRKHWTTLNLIFFKCIQVKPDSQITRAHGTCTGNSGKR